MCWYGGVGKARPELRRALTAAERDALSKRVADLEACLAPFRAGDRAALLSALAGLLGSFPQMQRAGENAAVITASYLATLSDRPRWAIEKVCAAIRAGRTSVSDFCPSEAKLNQMIGDEIAPFRARFHELQAVLSARVG